MFPNCLYVVRIFKKFQIFLLECLLNDTLLRWRISGDVFRLTTNSTNSYLFVPPLLSLSIMKARKTDDETEVPSSRILVILVQWNFNYALFAHLTITLVVYNCLFICLLYTSPSPRDRTRSRMPSSA